jgi:hypothetical protein
LEVIKVYSYATKVVARRHIGAGGYSGDPLTRYLSTHGIRNGAQFIRLGDIWFSDYDPVTTL